MPDPRTTRRRLLAAVAMAILLAACTDDPSDPQSPTSGPAEATTSIVEVRPTLADEGIPNWVGDVVNLHDLEDGACFNRYSWVQDDRHVELDTRVPCGGPHQHEVYLRTEHPARAGAPWPGDREMEAFARAQCYGAFADFVGEIYELSELELGYLTPSRTDFEHEDARFRGIHCYLLRDDGEEMVGSARDSRR
ncbi:uncharacterized protein METZ01_LOCUS3502 [marine metagenome]|uniref:Septum formation-related domain-containing protein n=1 Tax=marine metagenome TaxID=408172 RepID=A0A381NA89_9ZZZZ